MRFLVDCMLGKLAKWLKILGFDTLYFSKADDEELLKLAKQQRRFLLTRDHSLLNKLGHRRALLIESEDWRLQVRQVMQALDLWSKVNPFSRCLYCNVRLKKLSRENARNLISPFILEKARRFAFCPCCDRVFWQGTHFQAMEKELTFLFNSLRKED
ncbi:MAG: Mut7-C RNAse domain-containing protein [Candidatus Aminicenantes bacterium]|nr:Mut7-C RNAse domain-containing protein [Candidatus Aminicenantes bacterium]